MKITKAFDMRMQQLMEDGGSDNTYENYRYACKIAVAFFDCDIEDITIDSVQEYKKFLKIKHKPTTVRSYVSCLKSVISLCHRKGMDVINPVDITLPKVKPPKVPYLTEEQIDRFVVAANTSKRGYPAINRYRNVLIIKMLFVTGLRVSELVALNRDDIRDGQFSVTGKSKYERPCFITREIQKMIDIYLSMRDDDNEALFVSNQTGGQRI